MNHQTFLHLLKQGIFPMPSLKKNSIVFLTHVTISPVIALKNNG